MMMMMVTSNRFTKYLLSTTARNWYITNSYRESTNSFNTVRGQADIKRVVVRATQDTCISWIAPSLEHESTTSSILLEQRKRRSSPLERRLSMFKLDEKGMQCFNFGLAHCLNINVIYCMWSKAVSDQTIFPWSRYKIQVHKIHRKII